LEFGFRRSETKENTEYQDRWGFHELSKEGRMQDFNIRRRNDEVVTLVEFSRYDYELESIFFVFKICFLMHMYV
jgi:hypothetical protein